MLAVLRDYLVGDGGVTTLLGGSSCSRRAIRRDGLEGRHGSICRYRYTVGEDCRREAVDADIISKDIAEQRGRAERVDSDSHGIALLGATIRSRHLNEDHIVGVVLSEQGGLNQCVRFGCNGCDSRQLRRGELVGEGGFVEIRERCTVDEDSRQQGVVGRLATDAIVVAARCTKDIEVVSRVGQQNNDRIQWRSGLIHQHVILLHHALECRRRRRVLNGLCCGGLAIWVSVSRKGRNLCVVGSRSAVFRCDNDSIACCLALESDGLVR